jgi:ribulose 1,5-bisphosphate synthetase/thiazole synthase
MEALKGPANLSFLFSRPLPSHVVIMLMAYSTILIAGGGIIGNSISYYLAKRGISCTIIDE